MDDTQQMGEVLKVIGKRWSIPIIRQLNDEPKNEVGYMELKRRLDEISSKSLSSQLKQLVDIDLVGRREFKHGIPKRVNYFLTDRGIRLWEILEQIESKKTNWS